MLLDDYDASLRQYREVMKLAEKPHVDEAVIDKITAATVSIRAHKGDAVSVFNGVHCRGKILTVKHGFNKAPGTESELAIDIVDFAGRPIVGGGAVAMIEGLDLAFIELDNVMADLPTLEPRSVITLHNNEWLFVHGSRMTESGEIEPVKAAGMYTSEEAYAHHFRNLPARFSQPDLQDKIYRFSLEMLTQLPKPGSSGSPVTDKHGNLVGVVIGADPLKLMLVGAAEDDPTMEFVAFAGLDFPIPDPMPAAVTSVPSDQFVLRPLT